MEKIRKLWIKEYVDVVGEWRPWNAGPIYNWELQIQMQRRGMNQRVIYLRNIGFRVLQLEDDTFFDVLDPGTWPADWK